MGLWDWLFGSNRPQADDAVYSDQRFAFCFTIPKHWERRPLDRRFTGTGGQVAIALRQRGNWFGASFNVSVGALAQPEWSNKDTRARAAREFITHDAANRDIVVMASASVAGEENTVCVEYQQHGVIDGMPSYAKHGFISIVHRGLEYTIQWKALPDDEESVRSIIRSFRFTD